MSKFEGNQVTLNEMWDFQRSSVGSYFDQFGILRTAAVDAPRFQDGGILLEKSSTNSLIYNRDLSQPDWVTGQVDIAQDAVGVDGNTVAWTVGDSNSGSTAQLQSPTVTIPDDSNYSVASFFVRKDGDVSRYPYFELQYVFGTSRRAAIVFNTVTGDYLLTSISEPTSYVRVELRGDWWRISISLQNNGTGNTAAVINYRPAYNDDFSENGNGAITGSIALDYSQLEIGKVSSTAPISTAGSSVTRSTEFCSDTTISDWYRDDGFTIYGELDTRFTNLDNVDYWSLSDGTGNNRLEMRQDRTIETQTEILFYPNGSGLAVHTYTASGTIKFSLSYSAETNLFLSSMNGESQRSTGPTYNVGFPADRLDLLSRFDGANSYRPDGTVIRNIQYIPRAFSEGELRKLTNVS